MEKLRNFITKSGLTEAAFGALIGVDQSTVNRLLKGKFTPSLKTALAIERATGGKVPIKSWANGGRK